MSITDLTDADLAAEAREAPPPAQRKSPASVEALGRAIALISCTNNLGDRSPTAQADAATLDAFSDACGDAAMRFAELALRRRGVLS